MKIFFPLFVGALVGFTSLNNLNSQVEPIRVQDKNRLKATNQVIGCRLKDRLKATNQVRGCRLQVVATNQTANYRLQVADNSKTELPSEDQIDQRTKTTTNYELRTANCDNSAESLNCYLIDQGGKITTTNYELRTTNCNNQDSNLDCYLMMNPEEISEIGDILGFSVRKTASTIEENGATVTGQIEEAEQAFREQCDERNETHVLVGASEKKSWTWANSSSASSLYYQVKTIEAQKTGKTALAVGYREAVLTHERAANQFKRAVEAYTTGKESEGKSLDLEGNSLQKKADYQVKAIEAEEAGKTIIAAGCREAAVTSEHAVDQFEQSAKAYATENKNEGDSLYLVGEYFLLRARHQMLYARAEEREKAKLKKGINGNKIALNSTQADGNLNSEAVKMDNSLANKALFICCEKWLAETRLATAPARILSDYILDVIKRGADQSFVIDFEKYWSYAAKAHQLGDDPQALAWIQVAEDMQRAIKDNILRKTAQASDDWDLSTILKYTALATRDMARYRGAYLQAIVSSQNLSLNSPSTAKATYTSELDTSSSSCHSNITEPSIDSIAPAPLTPTGLFDTSSRSLSDGLQTTGIPCPSSASTTFKIGSQSPEIVSWRKKILEQSESIVACYRKAIEAVSSKNEQEYKCCGRIARSIKESNSSLGQAVFLFEESLEASVETEISTIWRKAAEQYQLSVEFDIKAAEEEIKGNTEEAVRLQEIARISRKAAKAIENFNRLESIS